MYLDPKNDIAFKKVFGQHQQVLISFLNALLPLEEGQNVVEVEYLNNEILPVIPVLKSSVVDIRCRDNRGWHFLVEMQMIWTESFQSRVLYNACKAYSHQINRGDHYNVLAPVYSLNIINDRFSKFPDIWYHHYSLAHQSVSATIMEGLSFVFIELPNFKPENVSQRKAAVLWLRFLKEIENNTTMVPEELLEVPAIAQAVEALKVTGYTREELEKYDKYWDIVRIQQAYVVDAFKKGRKEGRVEERADSTRTFTSNLIQQTNFDDEKIAALAGVDAAWVAQLRAELTAPQ